MTFLETLCAAASSNRSWICVGLDPDLERLPAGIPRDAEGVARFNREIIDATSDLVCAYKPNSAFYEALGRAGWEALKATIAAVPAHIPVILDAKRGDIGSTARAYAEAAFDELGAHAVTLSPYLGGDALSPFLERQDRGCFVLCRTSNPGGDDLQNLELAGGERLYERVARLAASQWNGAGNCGLVVGATYPRELTEVRALCPGMPILVPGVGAQGADMAAALAAGGERTIISASRSVLYADAGPGFAEAARAAAIALQLQG
ncbi:MAG TPA: orotidine-5'-phosphate decarboxylase [Herpetosiphonaceae bacterium]